ELRPVDLAAQEDDAVLRVDVDLPLGQIVVAEDDRLDLVHERRVVQLDLGGRADGVSCALRLTGRVRGRVVHELASPLRPVPNQGKELIARLVPASPPVLRIEEVGQRRAPNRSRDEERDLVPGAHCDTSDGSGSKRRAYRPRSPEPRPAQCSSSELKTTSSKSVAGSFSPSGARAT